MYELSIIQGVPGIFQVATEKYRCNYEVKCGVPDSIQVATSKECLNEEVDKSDPYPCDILPSSSDEDETASIMMYSKKKTDPSLNYWEGVTFHISGKGFNNSLIRAENYYRGHKTMHIHVQRSNMCECSTDK
jgi:hypothetical protein